MKSTGNMASWLSGAKAVSSRGPLRLALGIVLPFFLAGPMFAQYGGGGSVAGGGSTTGGYKPPKGGYSSGAAAGVAAGAGAGAAILFWAIHNRAMVTGCVQSSGSGLSFLNEKNNRTYALDPGSADLKAGERFKLKVKKTTDATGTPALQVQRLVKDLGGCNSESALRSSNSGS